MQAPAIKIPGPKLRLRPAAEREADVAIQRRVVGGHPPTKPHAIDRPIHRSMIKQAGKPPLFNQQGLNVLFWRQECRGS